MGSDVSRPARPAGSGGRRRLRAPALPGLLAAVADALDEHREEIDALNVFPVPDGDTGTNLATTARAAAAAATGKTPGRAAVRAALRAARGNSGVIYSQVVAAVIEAVEEAPEDRDDADVLADALERADRYARRAVAQPVEGTILTALRDAGDRAREQAAAGTELVPALQAVLEATQEAVVRTEHQLEVLERAGVVDAGARGLAVVMAAVLGWAERARPPRLDTVNIPRCLFVHVDDDEPFEVQFVVTVGDAAAADVAARLREDLSAVGGSVVVVNAHELVSAHVHTGNVDAALATADGLGEISDVQVTDLRDEPADDGDAERARLTDGVATVAIVPDGGLADLVASSGASVVPGAAGALPSAGQVADAIVATSTTTVLVLPGHPNAVPACRQAASLATARIGCEVAVVEEADHPLRVLAAVSLGADADAEQCRAAAAQCRAGEVVAAQRDGTIGDLVVAAGQFVALEGESGIAAEDESLASLRALLGALVGPATELVTIAVGDAVGRSEVVAIAELAVEVAPDAELELLTTGQRPSRYLVAAE